MLWSGLGESEARAMLKTPRRQSLRLNTLRGNSVPPYDAIRWIDHGYILSPEQLDQVKQSNEVANGQWYIQNAASWLPVIALDPQPGDDILDVCAAPGGKSSHIQAVTSNQSNLICNDNSKSRLLKLQSNMDRLGAESEYRLCDATRLSTKIEPPSGGFDKILVDAPCSGEGLMTLGDDKLFDSWSVAHIRRLSSLQKKILAESWRLLKPGGVLIYSTCTMAPEENESVVDYILRRNSDTELRPIDVGVEGRVETLKSWNGREYFHDLSGCLRLRPADLTEAFFVAKFVKTTT